VVRIISGFNEKVSFTVIKDVIVHPSDIMEPHHPFHLKNAHRTHLLPEERTITSFFIFVALEVLANCRRVIGLTFFRSLSSSRYDPKMVYLFNILAMK